MNSDRWLRRFRPKHVGIRWRNRDRTDGEHRLFVEDRLERNAVVVRFENAAVSQADVEYKRIARIDSDVRYATTHHRRSNRARLQILEKVRLAKRQRRRRRTSVSQKATEFLVPIKSKSRKSKTNNAQKHASPSRHERGLSIALHRCRASASVAVTGGASDQHLRGRFAIRRIVVTL